MADDKIQLIITALDQTHGAFNSLKQNLNGITGQVAGVTAAFRGLLTSAPFLAIANAIRQTANAGEEYLKVSKQMGISVENLSTLKYAAEQSEASFEELSTGLKFLSKALYGVNDEGKDTTKLLKLLGVTAKDTYQALLQIADAFSEMEDGSGKAAISMELFGRSGVQMISMLNEGSEGIKKLQGEVEEFSTEAAKAADKFNDNLNLMKRNIMDIVHSIGNELIPVLNELFDIMNNPKRGAFGLESRLKNLERDIKIYQEVISTGKARLLGTTISEKDIEVMKATLARMLDERQKILDKYYTHTQKGKFAEDKKPAPFFPVKSKAEKPDLSFEQAMAKLEAEYRKEEEEIFKKAAEARKWLADQNNQIALSEFDYQSAKLLEEYMEREKFLGWTEELYNAFQGKLKKIDDEEIEHKKATLRQIRDLELQHQLAVIDLKEKTFEISEKEAVQGRIDIYSQYLESLNEDYKLTISIKEKDEERLQILAKIDEIQGKITDHLQRQKELTGTFEQGMSEGIKSYFRELDPKFKQGFDLAKDSLKSLQDTVSSFSYDAMQGKLKSFSDYWMMLLSSIEKKLADMLAQWLLIGQGGGTGGGLLGLLGLGAAITPAVAPISLGTAISSGAMIIHQGGLIMHQGGLVPSYNLPRYHSGYLASDERAAILQTGERVLSRSQNKQYEREQSPKQSPPVIINMNVNATDADSFRGQLWRVKKDVGDILMSIIPDNHPVRRTR